MKRIFPSLFLLAALNTLVLGQAPSLPPSGDNQKCTVTQHIGSLVKVSVTYNSPDVTGPSGEDRTGKIWGTSVAHYGLIDQGFGTSKSAPWRAGANESTTIYFSHDVVIEGKPLSAGKYGLFLMLSESGPWTWIFSKNISGWGSYFYDAKDDVLRVEVHSKDHPHTEWLSYVFTDRKPTEATLELQWELKSIPMRITVPNMNDIYIAQLDREFEGSTGFTAANFTAAANFLLQQNYNLPKALEYVNAGMEYPFFGRTDFSSLSTKAQILLQMGNADDAMVSIDKAMKMPGADAGQIHQLGRSLIGLGKKEAALKVFTANYENNKGAWPTAVGMVRGLSAVGRFDEALKYATEAETAAPNQVNKDSISKMIEKLMAKQDVN